MDILNKMAQNGLRLGLLKSNHIKQDMFTAPKRQTQDQTEMMEKRIRK